MFVISYLLDYIFVCVCFLLVYMNDDNDIQFHNLPTTKHTHKQNVTIHKHEHRQKITWMLIFCKYVRMNKIYLIG